jgi:hypothetical protein
MPNCNYVSCCGVLNYIIRSGSLYVLEEHINSVFRVDAAIDVNVISTAKLHFTLGLRALDFKPVEDRMS